MASTSSAWTTFRGYERPLLIKSEFGQSDYSIYLTDLTNIWNESLERKSILRRALNADSSIDPSEDASQMRLLLSSIKQAINHEPGSSAEISSTNHGQTLSMLLTVSLPHPLADLRWSCSLRRMPESSVLDRVLVPLLISRLRAQYQSRLVISHIEQKDVIISKLMAQMQADGSDFGKVFPGAVAGRRSHRSNMRDELGKSVAGIAVFDEEALRKDVDTKMSEITTRNQILLSSCPIEADQLPESTSQAENGHWWNYPHHPLKISEGDAAMNHKVVPSKPSETDAAAENLRSKEHTPAVTPEPKKQGSTGGAAAKDILNDSTTDDSDIDQAAVTACHTSKGMKDTHEPETAPLLSNVGVLKVKSPNSDTTDTLSSQSPINPPLTSHSPASKAKPRLGRIGGKKAAPTQVNTAAARSEDAMSVIVNRKEQSTMPQNETAASQHMTGLVSRDRKQTATGDELEQPRETSAERADKNRERLKRELERSQAGGKKRRRF